jgi:hypothetical protein
MEREIVKIISDENYKGELPRELRKHLVDSIRHNSGLMDRLAKM